MVIGYRVGCSLWMTHVTELLFFDAQNPLPGEKWAAAEKG